MTDLPSTPVGVLKLGPSNMAEIQVFSKGVIEAVKNGEVNAIDVLVTLKKFEKAAGTILKAIQEDFVKEGDKYPEKSFSFAGAQIEKKEVGVKYDYSKCGDLAWERHSANEATAADRRIERETFLKSLKEPLTTVDEETGEVIVLRPPTKTGTTSLTVTIK